MNIFKVKNAKYKDFKLLEITILLCIALLLI